MPIPTELVGSLPRPMKLQEAYEAYDQGDIKLDQLMACLLYTSPSPRDRS